MTISHVLERLAEWEHLGTRESEAGSRLVALTPRNFPQAYLHSFFSPAPGSAWSAYGASLTGQLRDLYSSCNGLCLFAGSLSLWGLRNHHGRDPSAQFQPFDLVTHQGECTRVFHRLPDHQVDDRVFFGGYSEDGSAVFTRPTSLEVYRVPRHSHQFTNRWPDLPTFLHSEYDRIDALFTRAGYLADESASTLP